MFKKFWFALLIYAVIVVPASASVYGSLANFDVVNDTGETAHGFEIDIEGITPSDITSLFGDASRWPGMERYGSPVVSTTPTGVKIVYEATYSGGKWSAGTPSGTLPVSPSDSCWTYGAPNYGPNYPCDHFGVSTTVNTPNVSYNWLVETVPGSGILTPIAATVPNPVWTVGVPVVVNNIPQAPPVNVVIVAPQPLGYEFGEPRWVKVTATGISQDIAVEDLVAENAVIKKAQTQVQMEWQLLQVDSGSPGSGQIDLTGVALDPGAAGVVYRFEFYKYTGQRDPATNEALVGPNGDTPGAIGPSPGDLGAFIVAQNAGINFDGKVVAAPPIPIAPTLNATITGAQYGLAYSQVINAVPGNVGDTLTFAVTGLPSGLTLTGNTISGTPAAIGTFPLVITVTDTVNGTSTSGSTSMVVSDSPMSFPNPFTLPPATVGTLYIEPIKITGGVAPYTLAEVSNQLPAFRLAISGVAITGTPTVAGNPSITLQVTDHLGYTQSATATLNIAAAGGVPPPVACSATNKVITSVSLTTIDIGGGKATPGGQTAALPASINYISPATSLVIGELATFTGTVDKLGNCAAVTMTVAPGLSLGSPATLPAGQAGVVYTTTPIVPAGGVGPFTVSVSGLPQALSFDGVSIKGTPSIGMTGTYPIVISISDSVGETVHTNFSLTIAAPTPQQVTFVALPNTTYGAAPITLTATASDGLPVSYSVTGPASVLGSTLTITGAGIVTVTASQAGNASYAAAASVTHPFTVAKATLNVTATSLSRPAGAANPALTYSLSGFVAPDTAAVVSGSATLTTTAVSNSPAGNYPITFATGALAAANYTFTYVPGRLTLTPLAIVAAPSISPAGGTFTTAQSVSLSDSSVGAIIHYTIDGSAPTANSAIYSLPIQVSSTKTINAIAILNGVPSAVTTATFTINAAQCQTINYSKGFTAVGLALNGGTTVTNSSLQLTNGGRFEARSAYYATKVPVSSFTTDFTFQILNPVADGMTFVIQSAGTTALGGNGGGLGYAGIKKSVALKFDLHNNSGEGINSTGTYVNGAYPSTPSLDLTPAHIDLHSGHIFAVHLAYSNALTTGTITDTITGVSASTEFPGDITSVVGSNAYVGFTGATGNTSANESILTWSFSGGASCAVK